MATENLANVIDLLTPEQQESVRQFVHFLRHGEPPSSSPFQTAVDQFKDEHPELLRRLAQ